MKKEKVLFFMINLMVWVLEKNKYKLRPKPKIQIENYKIIKFQNNKLK